MKDVKVSELTVSQLQKLIRKTVQQAVIEVLIEFSALRQMDDETLAEAEITEQIRHHLRGSMPAYTGSKRDD
jgi:L-aminopeptidase/D-esterase-like protein